MSENNQKSQDALREEKILKFWKENKIFEKSLEKDSLKGEYIFYEGPPTANGKPGIHHLEARAFKDAIPRYKTMQGYHVRRKGGWDTHGLPVELQVEKKLGLNSKRAIEDYGIAKFNQKCKESVWEYVDLWEKFTDRIGYWIDQKNPYVTYHNDYIESVWNVIKEANKKKLLYKDYKVVPWCPRCQTTLSSHELAQGYVDVKDLSVTAKFKVFGKDNTYLLAWTTTPWTLPGNVALAVGKKIDYVKIEQKNEFYILAKNRLSTIEGDYEIVEEYKGSDLIGLEYESLYPYLEDQLKEKGENLEKAFKVYEADFVTTEEGTGIVHTAVMYGQDDFILGTEVGLPKFHLVGLDGKFFKGTGFLEGRFVRDENVAVDIIKDLAHRGLLFKKEKYTHSYPHCWRCKTALIYYARDSWYIKMSSLRDKLVKENEDINWEPTHIKEGRFGEWLRGIKDWAISRERYWGTPLPVWTCDKCQKVEIIESVDNLKSKVEKSGNKYFVMRHGETESNLKQKISTVVNNEDHLTSKGEDQVKKTAEKLKNQKIDYIIASPFVRTKDTAEIVAKVIGIEFSNIIYDDRLHEMSIPMYEGKSWEEFHKKYKVSVESFGESPEGNESYVDVKHRSMNFLYDIESKYKDKNILIVTHGGPSWLMYSEVNQLSIEETIGLIKDDKTSNYLKNGEYIELPFVPLPHDENCELDLHKPFIDEVKLNCSCGGNLVREKEVMDVWLDSGTMPFSQDHYPFENKDFIDSGDGYPADFISEAIDQTRGWFYTLHAVGSIMDKGKAFKNVICLGHLLDANGKKMSKSLGNIVDPWTMMDKYGVDTLRLWMYSVNQPGESKSFDEKVVLELHNKVFNLLYNILAFYDLYRDKKIEIEKYKDSNNILDKWIISRLNELENNVTDNMDNYKLLEPVRAIRDFIDDLSTWYVRRSRERLKNGDKDAKKTLYFVLKKLITLMAPFAPFSSEDIWQKLKNENEKESIHLVEWPKINKIDDVLIKEMKEIREVVTLGLQARQKAGIPVRQPLKELKVMGCELRNEYLEIIKEEVNIKEIIFKKGDELKVELDIFITPELKEEGNYRELVRAIQDLRKKKGLNPNDIIVLNIETNVDGQEFINKFKGDLLKSINAEKIEIEETNGSIIKIDEFVFKINIS